MSDKLKKFIRQYKSEFDIEEPGADLFNKIMGAVDESKIADKPKRKFNQRYTWMAAAASVTLVICALIFYEPEEQITQTVSSNNEQASGKNQNNNTTSNTTSQETNAQAQTEELNPTAIVTTTPSIAKSERGKMESGKGATVSLSKWKGERGKTGTREETGSEIKPNEKITSNVTTDESVVIQNPSENLNQQSTPPVNPQTFNQQDISENSIPSQSSAIQPVITDNTPSVTNNEIVAQPNEEEKITHDVSTDDDETVADDDSDNDISLGSAIKKGFFNFLSRKAKKWSGNTLTIENIESEKESVLAVHFKNEKVEFSRDIKLAGKE